MARERVRSAVVIVRFTRGGGGGRWHFALESFQTSRAKTVRRGFIGLRPTLASSAGVPGPGGAPGALLPERWRAHEFGVVSRNDFATRSLPSFEKNDISVGFGPIVGTSSWHLQMDHVGLLDCLATI